MGFQTFLQGPEKQPFKITVLSGCSLESRVVIPYVIDPALQNWKHGLKCCSYHEVIDLVFVCLFLETVSAQPPPPSNQNAAIWWMSYPPNQNVNQVSLLVSKYRSGQLFFHGACRLALDRALQHCLPSVLTVYSVVVWAPWSAIVKESGGTFSTLALPP